MLTVILLILKTVGIILLSIIGLLLLIIMLVLFVPLRYTGNVSKENGDENPLYAGTGVSWLLHILSASYEYNGGKTNLTVKVFGKRLKSREEKEEKRRKRQEKKNSRKRKEKKKEDEPAYTIYEYDKDGNEIKTEGGGRKSKTTVYVEEHGEETDILYPAEKESTEKETTEKESTEIAADKQDAVPETDKTENPKVPETEISDEEKEPDKERVNPVAEVLKRLSEAVRKLSERFERFKGMLERVSRRLSKLSDDYNYYHNALFNDRRNAEVISLITRKLKRLIKAARPRKVKGRVDFGSEDPSTTGKFLAAAAVTYPWYGNDVIINPDFENERLAFELELKGRIYICVLAMIFVQVYFNKKTKRFLRIMKKESSANG